MLLCDEAKSSSQGNKPGRPSDARDFTICSCILVREDFGRLSKAEHPEVAQNKYL